MTKALLDGDVLVYRIGFASEKTMYWVSLGDGIEVSFRTAKEAKEHGEVMRTEVDAMPLSFAKELMSNTIDKILEDTNSNEYILYLTGKGNFREGVAKTVPYKGNRSGKKPTHYQALRDYMIKELNAVLVEGQEADDEMASSQTRDTVICSIDKDLWMVPGKHYDIATGRKVLSKDPGGLVLKGNKLLGTGFAWFCAQMLMGDTIDNIKGIKGIGPAKAYKLLITKKGSVKLLWRRVRAIYKMYDQLHRLEESAVLLWMRREPEQHPFDWIKENT